VAARFLRRRGWRVRARRLRTPFGEIDLLAVRGGRTACVEVKTGRGPVPEAGPCGSRWRPGHRLDARRLRRLARAARSLAGPRGRVDLVEVVADARAGLAVTWHRDLRRPLARPARSAGRARGP